MDKRFDLAVIGSGSAAFAATIKASDLGASVVMIERGTLGGTCVNVGCVPSKHLLTVGDMLYYSSRNGFKGVKIPNGSLDLKTIIHQKQRLVNQLTRKKYVDVIQSLPNATLLKGSAKFISKDTLQVNGESVQAGKFVVATGSSTTVLPIEGINKIDYLTNTEALDLKELPKSIVVIGGGPLGLEFAQMYAHFATKVTLFELTPRILPNHEPEVSEALREILEDESIKIYTNSTVTKVARSGSRKLVEAKVNGKRREFRAEQLLLAAGRRPNTKNLGLQGIGVNLRKNGAILVDGEMQTSVPHVYAAGDVIGEPMLETAAAKEGAIAAENALTNAGRKMDFTAVPSAVFTNPQVANVGMTEKQFMEKYHRCACRTLPMSSVPKAAVINDDRGLIKMVINPKSKQIVGVHIVCENAADIIHEAALAVKFRLTIDDIIDTVHTFPTLAESIKLVAQSFYRDVNRMSCCIK